MIAGGPKEHRRSLPENRIYAFTAEKKRKRGLVVRLL